MQIKIITNIFWEFAWGDRSPPPTLSYTIPMSPVGPHCPCTPSGHTPIYTIPMSPMSPYISLFKHVWHRWYAGEHGGHWVGIFVCVGGGQMVYKGTWGTLGWLICVCVGQMVCRGTWGTLGVCWLDGVQGDMWDIGMEYMCVWARWCAGGHVAHWDDIYVCVEALFFKDRFFSQRHGV